MLPVDLRLGVGELLVDTSAASARADTAIDPGRPYALQGDRSR